LNVFTTVLAHENTDHLTAADIHVFTADVTSDDDIKRLSEDISHTTGGTLDVLVNCA
jgi:NAD(P)-dependent dehydrogenase (short-subunit alcohol dehydrogenase family)